MSYEFSYKPKDFIESRNFEYKIISSISMPFSYVRNFYSDLSLYNAPIFFSKEIRGGFLPGVPGLEKQSHPFKWFPSYVDVTKDAKRAIQNALILILKGEHESYINQEFKGVYKGIKPVQIEEGFNIQKDGKLISVMVDIWARLAKPIYIPELIFGKIHKGINIPEIIFSALRKGIYYQDIISGTVHKGISLSDIISGIIRKEINTPQDIISALKEINAWFDDIIPGTLISRNYASVFDIVSTILINNDNADIYPSIISANKYLYTQWYKYQITDKVPYPYPLQYFEHKIIDKIPYPYSAVKENIINAQKKDTKEHANLYKIKGAVLPNIESILNHTYCMYKGVPYSAQYIHFVLSHKNTHYKTGLNKLLLSNKVPKDTSKDIVYNIYKKTWFDTAKYPEIKALIKKEHNSFTVKDKKYFRKKPKDTLKDNKPGFVYRQNHLDTENMSNTGTFVFRNVYDLGIKNIYLNVWKNCKKETLTNTFYAGLFRINPLLMKNSTEESLFKNIISADKFEYADFTYRILSESGIFYQGDFLYRKAYSLFNINTEKHLYHTLREAFIVSSEKWFYKDKHDSDKNNTERFLYRKLYDLYSRDYTEFLYHAAYDLFSMDTNQFLYRGKYLMRSDITDSFLRRERYSIRFNIANFLLHREKCPMRFNTIEIFLHKHKLKGYAYKNLDDWLYRDKHLCMKNKTEKSLIRGIHYFMKNNNDINVYLDKKYLYQNNTEIFLNRNTYGLFIDKTEEFLNNSKREMFFTEGELFNRTSKDIYTTQEYSLYRNSKKNAFIKDTFYSYSKVFKDMYKNLPYNVYKNHTFDTYKDTFFKDFIKKWYLAFKVNSNEYSKKVPKNTSSLQEPVWANRLIYEFFVQNNNNVFKPEYKADVQKSLSSMTKNSYDLDINKSLKVWRKSIKEAEANMYIDVFRKTYYSFKNNTEQLLFRKNMTVVLNNTEWLYRSMMKSFKIPDNSLYRSEYNLNIPFTQQCLFRRLKDIFTDLSEEWLYRKEYGLHKNNTEKSTYRHIYKLDKKDYSELLFRQKYKLSLKDYSAFLYRPGHKLDLKDYTNFLYRKRHGLFTINTESFMYRKPFYMNFDTVNLFLHRERYPMKFNMKELFLRRERYGVYIKSYEEWLYRTKYLFDHVGHTINVYKPKWSLSKDTDISIGKYALGTFTDKAEEFTEKKIRKIFGNEEEWLNGNFRYIYELHEYMTYYKSKNVFLPDILLSDNIPRNINIIKNEWMWKNKYIHPLYPDEWLYRNNKNIIIPKDEWLYKIPKETRIYDSKFIFKDNRNAGTFKDKWLWNIKEIGLFKDEWVKGDSMPIRFYNNIEIYKDRDKINPKDPLAVYTGPEPIFYKDWIEIEKYLSFKPYEQWIEAIKDIDFKIQDTFTNSIRNSVDMNISNTDINVTHDNNMSINNTSLYAERINPLRIMDSFLCMGKEKSGAVITELLRMQAIVKEMEKPVEKTFEWAWVYTPDQPLHQEEKYHGLDELLLPEKDVDYSYFEDYIFNKNTMLPRNPVQIIDDTTFIAKLPIKHPTPKYEEVGIVYLDVRSELMYKIFCRYYEIWYANIYKFGNMSMVDSLRLMLDYMYSWIVLEYSGTEYFDEALRVFRQIRWFGEKSVMKNARYVIHYDKADLKCSLKDGTLKEINNDIGDTFIIRSDLNVITANPLRYRNQAEMNFYLDVKNDTEIRFNVLQAGGILRISLDGVTIENIIKSNVSVRIPIPEGEHTLQFIRPAEDNYASCYIGNIVLKDEGYTNLEITYDPNLMLGNMPLDDVAKKMMELALIYDENADAFEKYRKGNLAVSELHKELMEYWRLHHENKIKGKRLTIKEAGI